jgi:hypothetical protein
VVGVDDTVERHSGQKITVKGCYRETAHSSKAYAIHWFGLKWASMMAVGSGAVGAARLRWEAARYHPQAPGSPGSTVPNP